MTNEYAQICIVLLAGFYLLFLPDYSGANEFRHIGARSAAMGGAGVAGKQRAFTGFWNPANLSRTSGFDLNLEFGVDVRSPNDFFSEIDEAINAADDANDNPGDQQQAQKAVSEFNDVSGLSGQIKPDAAVGIRFGAWNLYSATSNVVAVGLKGDTFTAGDPDEYTSQLGTMAINEVGLSHGRVFSFDALEGELSGGVTLKVLGGIGDTAQARFSGSSDIDSEINDDSGQFEFENTTFSLDLGVSYKFPNRNLTVSFVGKNLTAPDLDLDEKLDAKLGPKFRVGASYDLYSWWTLAGDLDLLENDRLVGLNDAGKPTYSGSRDLSLGSELNIINRRRLNFAFRTGFNQKLGGESDGFVTSGIEIRTLFMKIDLTGGIDSSFKAEDGSRLKGNVSFFF